MGYTTNPAGSSGGSAEGASEGRQPLTGPHLPPAAQAAQIKENESLGTRRVQRPPFRGQALLSCLEMPIAKNSRHPAAQAAQIKESKSSRVRRTQQTPLKGQALPYSLKEYRKRKPTHLPPPEAAQTAEKEKPPCPQGAKNISQRTSPRPNFSINELVCSKCTPFLKLPPANQMFPRPCIQRGGACWHCAARREIAERSEEAPGAEAAQPSWNGGIWKALEGQSVGVWDIRQTQRGRPGGVQRGPRRGGSP